MKKILCYHYETYFPEVKAQDIFTCLHYDRHVLKWNNQVIENIYKTNEDEITEGSTYISRMKIDKKEIEVEALIIKMEIPNKFAVETKTKEGRSMTEYYLEEDSEGTNFKVIVSLIPTNLFYYSLTVTMKWSFKFIYNDLFDHFREYVYHYIDEIDTLDRSSLS
ncbi:DUF3284 domain-containing protein [Bacillus sp. JCM 19041]|uniref:DUF3284 domain-containing protein n=1 Tax=Bacillus sp. JCM 19041 TaxID=1460637 RepID=UPI0006D24940